MYSIIALAMMTVSTSLAQEYKPPVPTPAILKCSRLLHDLAEDQRVFYDFLAILKRDLDPETGKGFSLLDTSRWFPEELVDRAFKGILSSSRVNIDLRTGKILTLENATAIELDERLNSEFHRAFSSYVFWALDLVRAAIAPRETTDIYLGSIRITDSIDVGHLHNDSGEFTLLLTLKGKGTRIMEDGPKLSQYGNRAEWERVWARDTDAKSVATGHTLIISGTDRAKALEKVTATIHASPSEIESGRILLVLRFSSEDAEVAKSRGEGDFK